MDKEGEWSRSTVSTAVEKSFNLISINSTKISPLRVASVEMTTILLESVNFSIVEDHLTY
jgi:hypothetical protein